MAQRAQAQSGLFTKGCSTYVDALTAIEAFRREVKKVCKGAYLRQEKRLLEVMGLDPGECEIYDYIDDLEDRLAELGVRRSAQSGQSFYIYLQSFASKLAT
jgi:hypothetical protein